MCVGVSGTTGEWKFGRVGNGENGSGRVGESKRVCVCVCLGASHYVTLGYLH